MTGDKEIIKTRMMGYRPNVVFINADGYPACGVDNFPMNSMPDLIIRPTESIKELDFRFLVGLTVTISGLDDKRVTAVADACKAAKAKRVIANFAIKKSGLHGSVQIEINRIEDTEGHLNWESTDW